MNEQKVVVASYGCNKNHDEFKELNDNLRSALPDQQSNRTFLAETQTKSSQKFEKQTIKQTKQKYNLTLRQNVKFNPKAKFDPFKYARSKI